MKKYLYITFGIILGLSFVACKAYAISASPTNYGGTGTTTPSGILYGDNGLTNHLNTVTIGSHCTFSGGTLDCTGTGGGGTFPFTPTSYGVSTSTTIGLLNGFLSTASSTINSNLFLANLSQGNAYIGSNGLVQSSATTSLGVSAPITFSGTLGAQIGGANGSFGCTSASSGVTGCLTGTDWNTFNGKQNTISSTWPIILTGANLTFGWATTSQPSSSNLFVSDGKNGFYGVATSTLSASSPLTGSFVQVGSGGALGCQTASGSQAGCLSSADWNTFNGKQPAGAYLIAYDAWTHPSFGLSATTSQMIFGTSTASSYGLTIASTTAPQLALSAGAGVAQWTLRNAGGNLYFATTTVAGTATSTLSALTILGSNGAVGIGSTTPLGVLSVNAPGGQAAFAIGSSSATQFIVDKNGNVGIGTTSPYANLSVGGDEVIGASSGGGTLGNLYLPKLATPAGTFLAVDAAGKIIATTTPSGGGGLTGSTGQVAYFSGTNTAVGTSTITISTQGYVGIASTTPMANFSVGNNFVMTQDNSNFLTNNGALVGGNNNGIGIYNPAGSGANFFIGGLYSGTLTLGNGNFSVNARLLGPNNGDLLLTAGGASSVDIDNGGMVVGATYIGNNISPPINGAVIQGNVGIGSTTPTSSLSLDNASSTAGTDQNTPFGELIGMIIAGTRYMVSSYDYYGVHYTSGPTPTVTSCGTSPTVTGNTQSFQVTVGSVSATGCVIAFAKPLLNANYSINLTNEQMSVVNALTISAKSATGFTVSQTGLTGDVLDITVSPTR